MDNDILKSILSKMQKPASMVSNVRKKVPESRLRRESDPEDDDYVPVGVEGLLSASEKLLAVNRDLEKPDARDSLRFKRFMTTDKLLSERVKMDAEKLRMRIIPSIAKQRSLRSLYPFAFDSYTTGFLIGNPLSSPLEEINPMHLVEQTRRVTQMGPGGIGSEDALTEDMQAVRADQFGYISSLEGPESSRAGIDTRMAWGSRVGSDGKPYQIVYDRRLKKHRWVSPDQLSGKVVKIPD
jgi:DNA-directed RNA polymerase beta subunit